MSKKWMIFTISLIVLISVANAAEELHETYKEGFKGSNPQSNTTSLVNSVSNQRNYVKTGITKGKTQFASLQSQSMVANASLTYIGDDDDGEVYSGGAVSANADFRVRRALEMAGVNFTIDNDGDYEVKWNVNGSRTHSTCINSRTYTHNGVEFRKVWAAGFVASKINGNNLQALLELNSTYAMGAWEVRKLNNGQFAAVFSVNVPADATGVYLKIVSSTVAQTADGIEQTATHEDKL